MEMHHHDIAIWGSWQLAPEILLPLFLLTYLYLRLPKSSVTKRQRGFFFAGILSALTVIVTPIGARAMDYFSLHMVQHITLMMLTGPLLVLGTPNSFRPTNNLFKMVTHPTASWLTYAALMMGVHLPVPHKFIMDNPWAHTFLEVPLYLLLPYFFYFNLLDQSLINRRISPALSVISLFLMMVPETLTGFFIYTAPKSLYENMYSLNDQRQGGSFMWAGAMIIDTVWMSFAVYHWIKSEEQKSRDIDAEIAAGDVK
ncbi:MAG: cytochrome c oxidase assembly protein [Candidatus Planktophila sp.]|nr:cytochrome c oxidase assembly protein [Candidatus Planktophila sp.]